MKNATKGALAAAAAGSLLLGGAGSLAYWTDTGNVSGANIDAGHLKLASPSCDAAWKLNGGTFTDGTTKIKPGDELTRHCTYSIDLVGSGLTAKFDVSVPALTGSLKDALSTSGSTFTIGGGNPNTPGTPVAVANGDTVAVDLKVKFTDNGAPTSSTTGDNAFNSATALGAVLGSTTVSVTQDH